jgi:tetratricopeptide (TPR) repeat protein
VAGLTNASRLLKNGQAAAAIAHCHALLDAWPDSIDTLRYLGLGYLQEQRFDEAERYLALALRLDPASANLLNDLGIVHLRQRAYDSALKHFQDALSLDPDHAEALANIAVLLTELNQPRRAQPYLKHLLEVRPFSGAAHTKVARNSLSLDAVDQALRFGRKAVRLSPQSVEARLALADALETSGRFRQARHQYLTVLRHVPRQTGALARLLSMRQSGIDTVFARDACELAAQTELPASERAQLHLALARYHDRRGEYDLAFRHLADGNSISWKKTEFDKNLYSQAIDSIVDVFTADFIRNRPAHENQSLRPIFIIGMPRSGTTLVEQILASHSKVAAGGELSTITNLAAEVSQSGEPYPLGMRTVTNVHLAQMARRYLDKLETISRDACHVTDKMPFNFMHLGLITALFPDAPIIHCRRDPRDTCLSCYFTSFGENLLFAGELEALGSYYLDYRRIMAHWREVLPKPMIEIEYEQLISDTEQTVRSMLDSCALDWEPACLQFHLTDRGIRTPSRWQVRQPIYGHAVGRWRNYETQLKPLLDVLAPVLRADRSVIPQGL